VSKPTFYVACSSESDSARRYMTNLESCGFENAMDWLTPFGSQESEWPRLAELDVNAARNCDLFVLVVEPQSYGAMLELGARLGGRRVAHVVGEPWHFFLHHPLVTLHASWEAFVAATVKAYRLAQAAGATT
jgi:hypothetical protein